MKKIASLALILVCCFCLAACETMSKQDAGVVAGSVAGGLLGSTIGGGSGKIMAVAAGAVAGAVIGGAIGKNMDRTDQLMMEKALENNAVGRPAYWRNQKNGNQYRVVPVRNVNWQGNPYCREYRTVAVIDGRKEQIYGTACRRPNGTWHTVR